MIMLVYACKNKHGAKIETSTLRNYLLRCPNYLSTFEDEHQTSHEMKDESTNKVLAPLAMESP